MARCRHPFTTTTRSSTNYRWTIREFLTRALLTRIRRLLANAGGSDPSRDREGAVALTLALLVPQDSSRIDRSGPPCRKCRCSERDQRQHGARNREADRIGGR